MSMSIRQLADWARGSLRDDIGPEAAEVAMAIDTDLMLYGNVRPDTRDALEALNPQDRTKVMAYLGMVW